MCGFVFGVIGFWMLKESKRRGNFVTGMIAVLMIAYTYFVSNPILEWGLGIVLCVAAYFLW
jgi:NhaP-type Na+/H+ or K+/H+ antiporter